MKRTLIFILAVGCALHLGAAQGETMAAHTLRQLVERQNALFAEAAKDNPTFDAEAFRSQVQDLSRGFERLVNDNPKYAEGYAAYGYLLSKVDMRKEAAALMLKANQLDPNLPLVKNQLGNYLAEEGKPLEAVHYYLAAIKLAPKEPLYHYQLGTLLAAAHDDFIKDGSWSTAAVEEGMHTAFRQAAELAPERFEFAYRYGESFYDLTRPDWEEALKVWGRLEEKAPTSIERETMRLHAANIFIRQGKTEQARILLNSVVEPSLQTQKQKLVAEIVETRKK